jgi:hypothetical protein
MSRGLVLLPAKVAPPPGPGDRKLLSAAGTQVFVKGMRLCSTMQFLRLVFGKTAATIRSRDDLQPPHSVPKILAGRGI